MSKQKPFALEQRIIAILAADGAGSDEIATLLQECESAIHDADTAAAAEREKAHDPARSPDPQAALVAMQTAEFVASRMRVLCPRLQTRYQEVVMQERLVQWRAAYEALKLKRDVLATELREVYPKYETKVSDLLGRIAENDKELSQLHRARPAGIALHLRSAELEARGLESFTGSEPSLAATLKLPTFQPGGRLAWPAPRAALLASKRRSEVTHAFLPTDGGKFLENGPRPLRRLGRERPKSWRQRLSKTTTARGGGRGSALKVARQRSQCRRAAQQSRARRRLLRGPGARPRGARERRGTRPREPRAGIVVG